MTAPVLDVDPWVVREPHVDPETLPVAESVFSLVNGYVGIRGTLDEVDPHGSRGTFMSGVHETHPLAYPEAGYGHPAEGQAMVSVADGTPLRLLVDGIPLDVRAVDPQVHERALDLRSGTLDRRLRWRTLTGTTMEVRSRRLISLAERSVCAIRYEVRALDGPAHVVVRSDVALGAPPEIESDDPRVTEALDHPFTTISAVRREAGGVLVARTGRSGISVATAVAHDIEGGGSARTEIDEDHVVVTATADLAAGQSLVLVKTLGYVWSRDAGADSLAEQASAAVRSGLDRGWAGLLTAQRSVLDELWATVDVQIDGDAELQQALRYDVFQLFCSAACISHAPIGAKGLTGSGYSGHTFWDIEGFVLPALTLLHPEAAARLLRWRASTLDLARERAQVLELQGASFAWRTIDGREVSAYWPASTAAMHINADIARAFWIHDQVTGTGLDAVDGFEVVVETARLWRSMGHQDDDGGWHLFGMTGPDEYTGVVDDNVFTNLMARRNLRHAVAACEGSPDRAAAMGIEAAEVGGWRAMAEAMHLPWDQNRRVHPMNQGFTTYREWRFEDKADSYPIQEHQHYSKFYRRQVLKQADLVQALWWCRADFTDEEIARDLDYYEARTVRDSSLSASVQAVVCAQAQHPDLALRYLRESALVDLRDIRGDTAKGLHAASVGGSWLAFAAGLGGLRADSAELEVSPLLPSSIARIAYRITWRGCLLHVETGRTGTTITMERGSEPLDVVIDGVPHTVRSGAPASAPLREPAPLLPEPTQPAGREPNA